MKRIMIR